MNFTLIATNMEYVVPRTFRILFIGIFAAMLVFIGLNRQYIFSSSILTIPQQTISNPQK